MHLAVAISRKKLKNLIFNNLDFQRPQFKTPILIVEVKERKSNVQKFQERNTILAVKYGAQL